MLSEEARNQYIIDLIGHANEGFAKAAQIRDADYRRSQAVEAAIPDVLDALVANRRIAPGETIKMATALRDPVSALQVLALVAAHDNNPNSNSLGHAVKSASAHRNTSKARLDQINEEFFQAFDL